MVILLTAMAVVPIISPFPGLHRQPVAQESQQPAVRQERAKELWELMIAAKGGRERLRSVQSLLIALSTARPNIILVALPDKQWDWNDSGPPMGLIVSMCNLALDHDYIIAGDDPFPKMRRSREYCEGQLLKIQRTFLMETKWTRPTPVQAAEEMFEGKSVDAVFAMSEGRMISYLLDKATHLPVAYRFHGRVEPGQLETGSTLITEFADYADIGGIQMPTSIRYSPATPFIKHKIQINVDHDERVFLFPPSIEAGPDAWRPKQRPKN